MTDGWERLDALRRRSRHTVVGLISGTSADGIDAACVDLEDRPGGVSMSLRAFVCVPYSRPLAERVLRAGDAEASELADLDAELGEAFAMAFGAVIEATDVIPELIGSHGQTVFHRPRAGSVPGVSLQLGRSAVIAERTGLPVVSDFRARDLAAGGEGAPLVPRVDQLLLASKSERRVALNLGGIANLTALVDGDDRPVAFDSGPANALLDALVRISTDGAESYDADGHRAARGAVDHVLLDQLMSHPFHGLAPPRSADRDTFGAPLARRLIETGRGLDDLLATAVAYTATSIQRAVAELPTRYHPLDRVIISGGGVANPVLVASLEQALAPIPVERTDAHGLPSDAKEAIAFAVLARETLLGRPGNVPSATGASGPRVLGTISL